MGLFGNRKKLVAEGNDSQRLEKQLAEARTQLKLKEDLLRAEHERHRELVTKRKIAAHGSGARLAEERARRQPERFAGQQEREQKEKKREDEKKDLRLRYRTQPEISQFFTPAKIRELQGLIRFRYELDCKIWRLRRVRRPNRPYVEVDMRNADDTLAKIKSILDIWDEREYFSTEEEYQEFLKIKNRMENAGIRDWGSNPPWAQPEPDYHEMPDYTEGILMPLLSPNEIEDISEKVAGKRREDVVSNSPKLAIHAPPAESNVDQLNEFREDFPGWALDEVSSSSSGLVDEASTSLSDLVIKDPELPTNAVSAATISSPREMFGARSAYPERDLNMTDHSLPSEDTKNLEWNQFSINRRLSGVGSNYDESLYTTTIDRSDSQFAQRAAREDKIGRKTGSMDISPAIAHITTNGSSAAAPLSAPIVPNQYYGQSWNPYDGPMHVPSTALDTQERRVHADTDKEEVVSSDKSDNEDDFMPEEPSTEHPALEIVTVTSITKDFNDNQMLQDLLQNVSIEMPHVKMFKLLCQLLEQYHKDFVKYPDSRIKPHAKDVLGTAENRAIIARALQDNYHRCALNSDDEASETAELKAVTMSATPTGLNQLSHISIYAPPFQNLLNSIRELLLPLDLLDDLSSIPRESIIYETRQRPTILEAFQRRFETFTDLEWDWWPLPQGKKPLSDDESRVVWRCWCGIKRWRELPHDRHEILQAVLARRAVAPRSFAPCAIIQDDKRHFANPFRTILGSGHSIGGGSSKAQSTRSSAQSKYTPADVDWMNVGSAQGGSSSSNAGSGPSTGISSGNPTLSNKPLGTNKPMWVILGAEGPLEPLELSQIDKDYLHDDQAFIRELRRRHWELRGWPRILFSIWRLWYWEFVKFDPQPYGPNRAVVQGVDLPESQDYEYTPRPPKIKATDEGIRHSFTAMVQACIEPCPLESLPFGHRCRRLKGKKTHYVDRIPKRLKEWTNDDDDPDEPYVWGIQARYKPCILALWMIHTVIMSGAFGFWGWWQKNHPDDVQGASVPLTIAVALISLFWSTTGVIPSLR